MNSGKCGRKMVGPVSRIHHTRASCAGRSRAGDSGHVVRASGPAQTACKRADREWKAFTHSVTAHRQKRRIPHGGTPLRTCPHLFPAFLISKPGSAGSLLDVFRNIGGTHGFLERGRSGGFQFPRGGKRGVGSGDFVFTVGEKGADVFHRLR